PAHNVGEMVGANPIPAGINVVSEAITREGQRPIRGVSVPAPLKAVGDVAVARTYYDYGYAIADEEARYRGIGCTGDKQPQ
ncbi:MAG TPA: hypothetical protein VMX79_11080, partial [bacterium]|nr:hypothetical protein [bacterium]